ncbi:glycosyltransferase family 9 protein [Nibrella saemangeumensis]|uniref:Glycosyltransferase family 9 protein n=1 Tax=Nibrella saemangeumensis TaxID=1084526 RepID=A0ABP8N955_9BACT
MMSWSRFVALWTHRYHKYTHIAGKFISFSVKYFQLRRLKASLGDRQLIGIILSEQFGDIVACEPIAREVRQHHPDAYIIWFVRKAYVELVAHHPDLDGYLIEKCPGERERLLRSGILDKFYNLHLSHRKCKYCFEDPTNPIADNLDITYVNYYHKGNLLYVFSQAAGLPPIEDEPRLYIPEAVSRRVDSLKLPPLTVVIHCQSTYGPRDWSAANWTRLVRWILEAYPYSVVEVGLNPVVHIEHPRFHNLCGRLQLLETAEVIRRSQLFMGIDSGPAHLANAAGTDGIILLGQLFDFVEYMPYSGRYKRGEGATILNYHGHPCADLPYEWVQEAVEYRLSQVNQV